MKTSLVAIICICFSLICIPLSYGFQSVGEDFGTSWLEKYGRKPISTLEIANNLWNWGLHPRDSSFITAPSTHRELSLNGTIPIAIRTLLQSS